MTWYSGWPFFASIAALVAIAATPLFAPADTPPSPQPNRIDVLDGLRGFLALAVVFHHGAVYHRFLLDRVWELPPSRFYILLGQLGVGMFFMITGFLFWSRSIAARGRLDWIGFFIGRVFRIGPVYLLAVAAMLSAVVFSTGLHLNVPLIDLARQIKTWITLGIRIGDDVNGFPQTWTLLAGVSWSLHWEWLFYLALPVLTFAARARATHLPFVLVVLGVCGLRAFTYGSMPATYETLFLAGMLSASLHAHRITPRLNNTAASIIVVALLSAAFLCAETGWDWRAILPAGVVFYLITSGCTLFGLLTSRPARRLGDISYGIYLLQGLLLALVLRLQPMRAWARVSPWTYWGLVLAASVLLVFAATAAHVVIERPGIALGKRMARPVRIPRPQGDDRRSAESAVT